MQKQHQRLGCIILAGGQGTRLQPLTSHCAKPAIPFAGHYRVIDFVLSNCINSGCDELWVLGQYQVDNLHQYLHQQWAKHRCPADLHLVKTREAKLKGTAGAVFQQLQQFEFSQATHLLVLSADHVYKMDFSQMLDFHLEHDACMTIAAMPVPAELAPQFGVIAMDNQQRVTGFYEKPRPHQIKHLIDSNGMVLVSMGNYLFNRYCLFQSLQQDAKKMLSRHDFGHDIIPAMYPKEPVYVYDFSNNLVPGEHQHYWRDIGTQDAFFQAHMDLLGTSPKVRLNNQSWPITGSIKALPPCYIAGSEQADIQDSLLSVGCELANARITHSVLGPHCRIHPKAQLDHCVLLGHVEVGTGAKLSHCIVAENCSIAPYSLIGQDHALDRQRFKCTESGLVVVMANSRVGYH